MSPTNCLSCISTQNHTFHSLNNQTKNYLTYMFEPLFIDTVISNKHNYCSNFCSNLSLIWTNGVVSRRCSKSLGQTVQSFDLATRAAPGIMATYAAHKVHEWRVVAGSGTTDGDRWTFNRQMLQTLPRFNASTRDVQGVPSPAKAGVQNLWYGRKTFQQTVNCAAVALKFHTNL